MRRRLLAREHHAAGGQPATLDIPALLPGIKVSTSATDYHPIRQMQLQRWTGTTWERFGGVIEGANA